MDRAGYHLPGEETRADTRTVADVTCMACGCSCDDLTVTVEHGRVTGVSAACPIGRDWFRAQGDAGPVPAAAVAGRVVETGEAVARAVAILSGARAPVVWGLTRTTTEAVRAALELADTVGARVILDRSETDLGRVAAFQDQGRATATLGEVKNRADLVIFWGVDPLTTHPRHWERYSVEPRGRFVPEGRPGRTVVVVGPEETASSAQADRFVRVPVDRQVEALATLRVLIRGKPIAPGPEHAALQDLAARMKGARYGALFFQGARESGGRAGLGWWEATRLVRDLNEFTRFVILGMGAPGNPAGAEAALAWQGGYLQGVDYRTGRPTPLDDLPTLDDCLRARETDALLVVADDLPVGLSDEARAHLATIPTVLIGPGATGRPGLTPTVALATSTAGFDAPGTVVRSDGVVLPLRPVRPARRPDDRGLIARIIQGIRDGKPS